MSLDKFYTPEVKSREYISKVKEMYGLDTFDYIIEPSAGGGAFYKNLPSYTIALDIEPECEGVIEMDFFDFKFPKGRCLAIGNPPYGRRADFAKKFFNKCAIHCDVIAFVLPRSMVRPSMWSNINPSFHLMYQENLDEFELPDGSYFYRKSVFQIWERNDFKLREKHVEHKSHPDFEMFHINTWVDKKERDAVVEKCSIGIGQNSLKIKKSSEFEAKGSVWYIKPKNKEVAEIFWKMDFGWAAEQSSCAPSVSKGDIISEYIKLKNYVKEII